MTKPRSRTPHWAVFAAAVLSLGSIGATPKADNLAELLGVWLIPLVLALYAIQRTIQHDSNDSKE
jgi:hypothetical protein